ncbi:MAG: 50S ribosomal protein L4 [Clostridia bacterium]|nr:50S ribosomal protein L4 [Clostridia bacterium]MDD4798487.1 50S ribosomal protein L4 [Clostridia bacterium]
MSKVDLLNKEGTVVGDVELNDAIFARQINVPVMHQAVLVYLASQRRGTHQTKTRGEVSGTGKKPWRQKGLGRARVGGFRNPVWRGGGVAFGPHPRSYTIAMPKKMRRLALLSALSQKATEGNIVVVDELSFTAPQTKEMARILNNLSASNSLLVLDDFGGAATLSARNIPTVTAAAADSLNTYLVLFHDKLVLTKSSLAALEEVLG